MKYRELITQEQIEALVNKLGGMEAVQKFLAGELIVTSSGKNLIFVDRTIPAKYPKWVAKKEYPELESTGPAEFDAGKLELWLHDRQKNYRMKGSIIHQYLKEKDMLKDCLGLRDLEEIQKKEIAFFRKHFKGKHVYGWKSVVRVRRDGFLVVPCLREDDGKVCLHWDDLDTYWCSDDPALRFAST
jgi:hypothetical protein